VWCVVYELGFVGKFAGDVFLGREFLFECWLGEVDLFLYRGVYLYVNLFLAFLETSFCQVKRTHRASAHILSGLALCKQPVSPRLSRQLSQPKLRVFWRLSRPFVVWLYRASRGFCGTLESIRLNAGGRLIGELDAVDALGSIYKSRSCARYGDK